jgi:hypothetical protein
LLQEEYHQAWAKELKAVLRQMRTAADQARAQGRCAVPTAQRAPLLARYRDLLTAGLAANPPPAAARRPGQRGRLVQSPARNLLERLTLGREQVLAFLDDLAIPFDNHQAERDLHGLKVQQKVSGCYRRDAGAEASHVSAAIWRRYALSGDVTPYLATLRPIWRRYALSGDVTQARPRSVDGLGDRLRRPAALSCLRVTCYLFCSASLYSKATASGAVT